MNMHVKDKEFIMKESKLKELQDVNVVPHFKHNIINWEKNCHDSIEDSKYCFACKQSVCSLCAGKGHDQHLLLPRKDYLFYREELFTPIEKVFNEVLSSEERRQRIKTTINQSFNSLNAKVEQLRLKKLSTVDKVFNDIDESYKELLTNFDNAKKAIAHYYKSTVHFDQLTMQNLDRENTLFLMNFEMITLFEKKTNDAFNAINAIHHQINEYNDYINESTSKHLRELDLFLERNLQFSPFDNFYWDIKLRTKTYIDQINLFKATVAKSIQEANGMDKLTELMNVFDSKNRKGIDFIYNQQYFSENYRPETGKMKIKGSLRQSALSPEKNLTKRTQTITSSSLSQRGNRTGQNSPMRTAGSKMSQYVVCLDNRVIQRLFGYSLLDTYNKCFNNSNDRNTFNTNLLLESYTNRENALKETVKPIIASNEISIFNPIANKISKYTIVLDREQHGYDLFPNGSRHICIDGKLYITGGVDSVGNEMSIALSIELKSLKVRRLESMLTSHSYHSIEYLDNFDCFIVIGGDHNLSCELFDLFTRKWTRLPNLNYWRANANIYYDNVTSDVYALFGMVGTINEAMNTHSDIIEVLELKDIMSGWIKVDYYKSSEFDLKMNFCNVLPYTRDKLMIYGAAKSRIKKKCFALFDLKKNEIFKFNENMMDSIRLEGLKRKEDEEKVKFER